MNSDYKIAPPVIRLATKADLEGIFQVDPTAQREKHRKEIICRAVENGDCYIAEGEKIKGYAILEYTFFEMGFVSLLVIHPDQHRSGLGSGLMSHLESICRTRKIFTSTNQSNLPMQALLSKLGYESSGIINGLDEGDPELIYKKEINQPNPAI
jgi:N-acetylglutamate synthase-like GNAT family acetyltransferase